jgi:ATP-dependent phosphofructokinase / diphosphate-dependent phosphofructokinase
MTEVYTLKLTGKVLVAQGGGPTAVINQSLVGAVLESRKFQQVTKVYGAINGVNGIINEKFIDLTQETTHNLEQIAVTPSSALRSTRDKPDEKYCLEIFQMLQAHEIRYFFYIGGNDSADTVRIVNAYAEKSDYEFRAIHIPKTIDNDLLVNDHTPGYGSAAKFVAQAFTGVDLDNRALPGVFIGVVMGREAGFLTAASALAQKYHDDGPHLIYMPERVFSLNQFTDDVKKVYDRFGRCVVAVSEGVSDDKGTPIAATVASHIEKDAHGNINLSGGGLGDLLASYIKEKLGVQRVRSDTFGYLQRSFPLAVSSVDQSEAREVGEKAAQFAIWYDTDGSVTIHRTGDYSVNYQLTSLDKVARFTRSMPDEYINAEGNYITEAFKNYARPLVGSLPSIAHLRAPSVARIIKK